MDAKDEEENKRLKKKMKKGMAMDPHSRTIGTYLGRVCVDGLCVQAWHSLCTLAPHSATRGHGFFFLSLVPRPSSLSSPYSLSFSLVPLCAPAGGERRGKEGENGKWENGLQSVLCECVISQV